MDYVFISKVLMFRGPHCAPSKASCWAHQKYQGDTPFTHAWERKSQAMCTAACASKWALDMLCAANKAWRAAQAGTKPQKHSRDWEPIRILGSILHCHDLQSWWDVSTQGSNVLGSFGTSRLSLKHPEEVAKWATCFETVLHWCSCGQRHLV